MNPEQNRHKCGNSRNRPAARIKKACSCRDFFEKGCAGQPSDLALNDFSDGKTGGWQRFVGEKPAVLETIAENAAIFFIKEVPSVALPEGYKKQMWKVKHSKKVASSYAAP